MFACLYSENRLQKKNRGNSKKRNQIKWKTDKILYLIEVMHQTRKKGDGISIEKPHISIYENGPHTIVYFIYCC